MRMPSLVILATLGLVSVVVATDGRAQAQDERLRITLVADEAEAVLSILEARAAGATPPAAAWERLFTSEGYRRLKAHAANQRGRNLPLWSERLVEALPDPEAEGR